MTEKRIFEILLENKNKDDDYNFDYPTLQEKTALLVAHKFTDIIYETLKQKSSASSHKRGNLLKFINALCEVKECHQNEASYRCYLNAIESCFKTEDENVSKLFYDIKTDMNQYLPDTFAQEVVTFYKKKHSKQKKKIKDLEFIKTNDQERLNTKYDMAVRKSFSYYETNEELIQELLGKTTQPCSSVKSKNISQVQDIDTSDYREKQIKLCYALINLGNQGAKFIPDVRKILQRLSNYPNLKNCEINFIQYLWASEDSIPKDLLVELFPFLLERLVMKYATQLLSIREMKDADIYFTTLENDDNFLRLREVCQQNSIIYYKMKNLINELYCYSYCNVNVLKFVEFII